MRSLNVINFIKSNKKKLILLSKQILLILLFSISLYIVFSSANKNNSFAFNEPERSINYSYLSNLDFITDNNLSYNGWSGHPLQKDKNQDGGTLSLVVNGEVRTYTKGLGIHGTGQATFDISELSTEFPRFIAKIGVDATRKGNGSLWIQIFVSNDGNEWTSLLKTGVMNGLTEAVDVDLNVEGYRYLRIHVNANGANAADHGTIANARLVTKDFNKDALSYDRIHNLSYYDEILKSHDAEYNMEHNYRLILEREFVNKIGFWTIQDKAEITPEYINTLDWLISNNETLEQIIEVGEVASGSFFLDTLHTLYKENKEALKTENGYVYQKMLIALAAAYKTDNVASPLRFSTSPTSYDVKERYRLMKLLFDTGKFDREEEFKGYHVELMRFVMQDAISNEELIWLNEYSRTKKNPYDKYSYISYRYNPNYNQPAYKDPANKEKYDQKYLLSKYNVPYGDDVIRYWMAFEYGGICWNISRIGQTINKIKGVPSVGIYQPDHEAYLIYRQKADGTGVWDTNYNIFGWGKSSTKWWGGNRYRLLLNWANKSFSNQIMNSSNYGTSSGYMLLGQAALNRQEEWKKSLYLNYLANSYDTVDEKVNIYNKALENLNINLDSFDYIVNLYKTSNQSSAKWHELASKIIDAYTYYPNAMYDLLKVIKPYLQGVDRVDIDLREQEALIAATKATDNDVLQSGPTRELANAILGRARQELASFSFDGDNAGKIIINSAYDAYDFNLSYSIDGGKTYSSKTTNHVLSLTPEEISKITADNDIKIRMDGTSQIYTIDITTSTIDAKLFPNDLENRVVGITLNYEWRNDENSPWTSYKIASPDNTGNKTLYVRKSATGKQLASDSVTYTFTEDNQPNTRKYVPVSHLSIEAYSTQSVDSGRPFYAPNAIDGNGNTLWHTDFRENVITSGNKPFITIKLDKPRYISAVEFKQIKYKDNDPDYIKNAKIYVSEDGTNWIEAGKVENCPRNLELRDITFEESVYGQYIKIDIDTYDMFASLSLVNVFQDLTKNPRPTAGVEYSTTDPTKENVIARLVNVSTNNYDIIDEDGNVIPNGDTHVFTDNGEYTFRFIDKDTNIIGTSKAVVNWIDRKAPTATIEYSIHTPTNHSVIATLKPNENVIVTNNGDYKITEDGEILDKDGNVIPGYTSDTDGNVKDESGNIITNINTFTYEFYDNGEFTFEFVDRAGNKGSATAKVDWIDYETPIATLLYNIDTATNKNVTVNLEFNESVIITNNQGKKSYTFTDNGEFTFEFKDLAGNTNKATARVNWIDKVSPTASLKYEYVNNKVIVKVVNPSKEITFDNGIGVYEFTKNGTYEIVFYDKVGNVGKLVAIINHFKENNSNNNGTGTTSPSNPDKPNQGNNSSNQGGNGSKPNSPSGKPNTPNNGGNSNNSSNNKPNTNTPSTNPITPSEITYKEFYSNGITIHIPENSIKEEVILSASSFELPGQIKGRFNSNSETYNLYLTSNNSTRLDFNSDNILKISFRLKSNKEFEGIYEILDNNEIKELPYILNGNNIEITTYTLGRYVVAYKGDTMNTPLSPNDGNVKKEKNNTFLKVLSILVAILLLGGAIIFYLRYKNKKEEN